MQNLTLVLSSETFTITKAMQVLRWKIFGLGSDAAFTYLGNAKISDGQGGTIPSGAVPLSGQVAYNSDPAPQNSPWENVVITVSAGSVCLELSTE